MPSLQKKLYEVHGLASDTPAAKFNVMQTILLVMSPLTGEVQANFIQKGKEIFSQLCCNYFDEDLHVSHSLPVAQYMLLWVVECVLL